MRRSIKVTILFFVFFVLGFGLSAVEKSSGNENQLDGSPRADWLQFSLPGHVARFARDGIVLAAGDHAIRIGFVNANRVEPVDETNGAENSGETPRLERVVYKNLWDHIDLVYEKTGSGLMKSSYIVSVGGNPADIRLEFNGEVEIGAADELKIDYETGRYVERQPVSWQLNGSGKSPVVSAYRIAGKNQIGFSVSGWDGSSVLVIDPISMWNTFLGGTGEDRGTRVFVDGSGNIFVTGSSNTSWGSPVNAFGGSADAFVVKLDANGVYQWHTFLGGSGDDRGYGIYVDGSGYIFVAGSSSFTWGTPINPFSSNGDAFVAILNPSGVRQWHTFLGGSGSDVGRGIVGDGTGNVYITGYSGAGWGSPLWPYGGGSDDAFVARLNSAGALLWNTFLGGTADDWGIGIAYDNGGYVVVTGYSPSTWGSPISGYVGGYDVFLAKLATTGVLGWSTFLGSSSNDWVCDVAVDASSNILLTGVCPTTWGSPVHSFSGGIADAFVVKFNSSGILQWNTFQGGSNDDSGYGIALDSNGMVYVSGRSKSTWGSPVNPFVGDASHYDAFVFKLNLSGVLQWNTFMGGIADDQGVAIVTDNTGNICLTGDSNGNSWGEPIRAMSGGWDAFVAKLTSTLSISGTITVGGSPLAGVTISGLPGDPITDTAGKYSAVIDSKWSGTAIPVLSGYGFSPNARTYTNVMADQTGQDYTATLLPTYTISGLIQIVLGGGPLAGVQLNGLPGNPVTDENGQYSVVVTYGWTGTAVPALSGYIFAPVSRYYPPVTQNWTSQNYNATSIHTVTFIAGVNGVISGTSPQTVEHGSSCTAVTANADSGHHFVNWTGTGGFTSTDNPLTVANVTQDMTITANFALNTYTVTFSAGSGGSISGTTPQTVSHGGSTTAVSAVADGGYAFVNWTGDYSGSDNPLTITNVTADMNIAANFAFTIPSAERAALIALYNSTNGDSWLNNSGWKTAPLDSDGFAMPGTEGGWHGVTVASNHVTTLALSENQLNGTIPSELGDLTSLHYLWFTSNQLSGAIPSTLGNLTGLTQLLLNYNQLTGPIPSTFGNLVNLEYLYLHCNMLSGAIPVEFANLSSLGELFLTSNALYSNDAGLTVFLDSKNPGWAATQTIAPSNIVATPVNSTTINLTWDVITFTGGSGGYRIYAGTNPGGPYTFIQQTASKTDTSMSVTDLNPNTAYYFVIRTRTDPHDDQANTVDSEYSAEVSASTSPAVTPAPWNTFAGGGGSDGASDIAVDNNLNICVVGSSDATWGAPLNPYNAGSDALVAKFNAAGALLWHTFLGGGGDDGGVDIAMDGSGNIYVVGRSTATWGSPVNPYSSDRDVFVAKLNASGTLQWLTFLGGSGLDNGRGIAVDGSSNVYVIGYSEATWGNPIIAYSGTGAAFAAKLNVAGVLQWNTFLNGSGDSDGYAIAVTGGDVFVTGASWCTWGSPILPYSSRADVFVAKLNAAGALQWNTFLGGSGGDIGRGITVDGSGNVFIAGFSSASWGSPLNPHGGDYDAVVAKLNGSGGLQWHTFLGGSGGDYGLGLSLDGSGNIFVTGDSNASWGNPLDPYGGDMDAFVAKLNSSGAMQWNAFLGGSGTDEGSGIVANGGTYVYVSGNSGATWGTPLNPFSGGTADASIVSMCTTLYTISGTVTVGGSPLAGVQLSGLPGNPLTNASGYYSATVLSGWAGTVTPALSGYTFSPASISYPSVTSDQTGQDYAATLVSATLTVTSPNGGENWNAGDNHDITWSSTGSIANVNIDYSIDNGSNWNPVVSNTPNDGSYSWTVPSVSSTTCLVRVSDAADGGPTDSSNAVFTITVAETVSAPSTPSGPDSGLRNTSYSFTTGGSTSSLGHDVQYKFDWDDGSDSGWLAVGTTQASHSWSSNGTYQVQAMARCATHTNLESLWSDLHSILISDSGSAGYYNSPASRVILPEVNWALASGGGTWMVEAQVIDISGGSQVSVYYNHAGGRRGPFLLWTGTAPGSSVRYDNLLDAIDQVDSGTFTYYGTVGAVEFVTQDATHLIQVAMRQYNGNYSKTHPGLADVAATTACMTREMVIPNLASNATYRTFVGCFNPSADSVTVEFRLADGSGAMIGTTVTRTIAGYGYDAFNVFTEAGMPYPGNSYTNAACYVHATSGSGRVMCFGATANNSTNDPATHVAVQTTAGYDNSPADRVILPEVNWALASGGGTWMVEAQVIDISGGSQVSVYYNHAGGRRGPFLLWTGTGAGSSIRYDNLLDAIDQVDSGAFTYYGTVGAVEFVTQDATHLIQVSMRQYNGNYSKTHPGLADVAATTACMTREMVIPNLASNATYRTFVGCFNPSADSVTVEFRLVDGNGSAIGTTVTKTIAGYGYQAFNVFTEAGVPYPGNSYSNAACYVQPTSGSGRVMCFGATANNSTNDPAAHVAVQGQ